MVVPAYAGVILADELKTILIKGGSRVCGGDPQPHVGLIRSGSVVPAYAGVILVLRLLRRFLSCGSRVCGGDPDLGTCILRTTLWFPRMRG